MAKRLRKPRITRVPPIGKNEEEAMRREHRVMWWKDVPGRHGKKRIADACIPVQPERSDGP